MSVQKLLLFFDEKSSVKMIKSFEDLVVDAFGRFNKDWKKLRPEFNHVRLFNDTTI